MQFTFEMAFTGAQNTSAVISAKGTAIFCIKGILRPLGFLDRSERFAIMGSVTASNTLPSAAIPPITVAMPKITRPCGMNSV